MIGEAYTVGGVPDWSLIPRHMRAGLDRYIVHGVEPGDFLSAVISNDLREAFARADSINELALRNFVQFLYWYAPAECWGSRERFQAWMAHRGLQRGEMPGATSDNQEEGV